MTTFCEGSGSFLFFFNNNLLRNSLNFDVGIYEIMTAEHISKKKRFQEKGLTIGTKAPIIETNDIYGNGVSLNDLLRENDFILIDFYRGAWWKPCKKHLKKIRDNIEQFNKWHVKVIIISTDSIQHTIAMAEEHNFKFTMISDRGAKIAKTYNVYTYGSMLDRSFMKTKMAVPSDFLIDRSEKIVWRYIGARKDRPTLEILTNAIDEQ